MWCIPIIPMLGRLRQGDQEVAGRLDYIIRPYL